MVTQLLLTWGYDGWIRWLHGTRSHVIVQPCRTHRLLGLAVEYKGRRDFFVDTLADEFHVQESRAVATGVWAGCNVLEAYSKPRRDDSEKFAVRTKYFSFVPPTSGMFIWVRLMAYIAYSDSLILLF